MAPGKRTRSAADSQEPSDVWHTPETRAARPNHLSESQLKRRRLSPEAQSVVSRDGSNNPDAEESSDEDVEDEAAVGAPSPPQTQYELMRDAGFRHLQNTDKDDLEATQKLNQRPTSVGNNMAAESGIIESITCYNFMCHERLHVELGPLINFIVGENGSGKSAVLTALTLCLGGKASDTNRGGSLKSFVKEGRDHASLVVRIKNAGSDAYQPDVYGNFIVVERYFSRTGSSGFKIKNDKGRIISTKKQEVDEISEWYALQMGNPLMVLSQDNARQFLNSATPAQKYKYFVSGVQLEQLDNDYKMSQDTLDRTLILQEDLQGKLELVKKEMEESHRLANIVSKNSSLRERARHYRNQMIWSQVVEQERGLEKITEELEARAAKILELENDCVGKAKAFDDVQEKLERSKKLREGLNEESGAVEESIQAAEEVWTKAKKELQDQLLEERDAHSRLTALRSGIATFDTKIQGELQKLNESSGPARAEKESERDRFKERQTELMRRIDDERLKTPVLQSRKAEAEQAVAEQQRLQENKRKDIVLAEQRVQELKRSTGSKYDGFDREIPQLARAVASDPGFENKPLGPLGAYVKLLKPEWAGILDKTLGEALNAFVVRSKRDQSRLSALMRRLNMRKPPPVYIAYGGRIETTSQEPPAEFDTILRVLDFDEEVVRSQFIINNQIEKVILIKERVEAQRVMIDNGPPPNVAACLCFHDGKGKRGQGLRYTNRGGTIGSSPVVTQNLRSRMQSDSARQLDLQRDDLKQLELELLDINAEDRRARQELKRTNSELEQQKNTVKDVENELRRTDADVEKVLEELDSFEGIDARLDSLRAERDMKKAEEEQLGNQYGNLKLGKRELSTKAEEAKKKLDEVRQEQKDFQNRVHKADEKVRKLENMRRIALMEKNAAYESVDIEKSELRRAESKRVKKREAVEDFIRQAEEVAPDRVHVPEDEDYRSIEKKYEKIREQLLQREARQGATDEQIFNRAHEAKAKYDDFVRQTQDVDQTVKSLKYAIADRLNLWRQFQRQISARIRIQFNYLLSERGFRGKIDLDHPNRKVNIHIEPDETRKSSVGRNTKTLSGGEKSFSSICMLLSVWEAIGSPIRCLDEFDVFMDNVNRAISTNMLVSASGL
ncbi:hypothetical protein UVI_02021140 [Ustilaginoidea virens]|uniref:Rad50/SbcC-type AAA domain-containing protein n=1 Tax=Ustilaginoidea virens TaxID=1159556 RepID=A0A1B5KXN8_USTVR|nr:hypothetical protein UVI_02021140 [Ustilaginoidea virens]